MQLKNREAGFEMYFDKVIDRTCCWIGVGGRGDSRISSLKNGKDDIPVSSNHKAELLYLEQEERKGTGLVLFPGVPSPFPTAFVSPENTYVVVPKF